MRVSSGVIMPHRVGHTRLHACRTADQQTEPGAPRAYVLLFSLLCRRDPPDVSSGAAFSQWMCRAHNAVNRRLGKPTFNCDLVGARWAPLDCDQHNSCDMTVGRPK